MKQTLMPQLRFSDISARRQAFLRQCQRISFGKILGLTVNEGEPVFGPRTRLVTDLKLDSDEPLRKELYLGDFALCAPIVRLLSNLDAIRDGTIDVIKVRGGLPVCMSVSITVQE